MIEHVYRRAADARGIDGVVVATDDVRIVAAVERFGGIARLTATTHRTGTDRIAEIAKDLSCDIVVNVQGDLPLIEPGMISEVLEPLMTDASVRMTTLRQDTSSASEISSSHVVKVVVDSHSDALYFSRSPIPFRRDERPAEAGHYLRPDDGPAIAAHGVRPAETDQRADVVSGSSRTTVYKHIGLYGFRRDFLLTFAALPQTPLEQAESLEQLRALEHGFRIRAVATKYESIEVDTPEDLERVRQLMATRV
jgi:3-deoxy-manno-octulosonate cytidylyltransferase (CMP-KDO synthetase)